MKSITLSFLLLSSWLLCSCSAHSDRTFLEGQAPLFTKNLCIDVKCDGVGERPYGKNLDWQQSLEATLWDLGISEEICGVSDSKHADMKVEFHVKDLSSDNGSDNEIIWQGAILDFIAWSTIPLLPLWIQDVEVDTGISVDMVIYQRTGQADDLWTPLKINNEDVRYPVVGGESTERIHISTSMLDRYPVFSWQTLMVLVLPPFVFTGGDRDHLQMTIAEEVRRHVGELAASFLREYSWSVQFDELIRKIELKDLGDQIEFTFHMRSDLNIIKFSSDKGPLRENPEVLPHGQKRAEKFVFSKKEVEDTNYIRITAISDAFSSKKGTDKGERFYTIVKENYPQYFNRSE